MKKSDQSNKPLLAPAFRRKIAEALAAHIEAHLPSGQPARISLHAAPIPAGKRDEAKRFVASAVLPVYVAQLNQLARAGVGNLTPSGLLLLLSTPSQQNLLVEVGDSNQAPPVIRVVSGDIVNSLQRALTKVAALPKQKQISLRILRVPSLHLYAVWRHSAAAQQASVCLPFTSNFAGVEVGRRYTLRRFEKKLQAAALQSILRWYERTANEQAEKNRTMVRSQPGGSSGSMARVHSSQSKQSAARSALR